MMWHRRAAVWFVLAVGAAAQDPCVLDVHGARHGVRVGGAAAFEGAGHSLRAELAAGRWRLRFPAGAGGRPEPVAIDAPAGGVVAVAVADGPEPAEVVTVLAASLRGGKVFERSDERSARVSVRMRQPAGSGAAGIVARWHEGEGEGGYRFVRDQAKGELRLERQMGASQFVLGRAPMATDDGEWHDLELECHGFGLLALFDGEVVVRALDGGLPEGGCGTFCAAGVDAEFADLRVAPPAVPLATLAVAATTGQAEIVARAPAQRGGVYALTLRLDRPTAIWPTDALGFEPFVLVRPAEPIFLLGFACGDIGDDGAIAGLLRWPDVLMLRGQAALVGGYLGSPDGSELRARLPWAKIAW